MPCFRPAVWPSQVRLFTYLFYGSCTSRFAVMRTPRGLGELVRRGALSSAERDSLLRSCMGHNAVLEWITTLLNSAIMDGRLCGSTSGGSAVATQISLQVPSWPVDLLLPYIIRMHARSPHPTLAPI